MCVQVVACILAHYFRKGRNSSHSMQRNSLQRIWCKESKGKYYSKIANLGTFWLKNPHFLDIFHRYLLFQKIYVSIKNISKKIKQNMKPNWTVITILIQDYKILKLLSVFISKIFFCNFFVFFAFFAKNPKVLSHLCKEWKCKEMSQYTPVIL